MIDSNFGIQLPQLISNGSKLVLSYDEELQITTGIKTDGAFDRFIMGFQDFFDSSKQWVPVKTREGQIVHLQKSKAAFDKNDKSRPEVIEALYVQKVWSNPSQAKLGLGSSSYISISARKAKDPKEKRKERPNERLNGYLLLQNGTVLVKEKSRTECGATKTKKNVVNIENNDRLARLVVKDGPQKNIKRIQKEYGILGQLTETNGVVRGEGLLLNQRGDKASLLEPLFDASLPDDTEKLPKKVRDNWKMITAQLIFGLEGIHAEGVSHNDIKGPNILIQEEKNGTIKAVFTDFELATAKKDMAHPLKGTSMYFSPEKAVAAQEAMEKQAYLFSFNKESEYKADVWALGLELYRMKNGKYPDAWKKAVVDKTRENALKALCKLEKQDDFLKKPVGDDPVDHLIWQMLQVDPENRPTMAEVGKRWNAITH